MHVEPSRRYIVTLQVDGLLSGVDWVPSAFAEKYPVAVIGQGPARAFGDTVKTDLVVTWRAVAGDIAIGDVVRGLSIPNLPEATAVITGVAEANGELTGNASSGFELVGATLIVCLVAYAVSRLSGEPGVRRAR